MPPEKVRFARTDSHTASMDRLIELAFGTFHAYSRRLHHRRIHA
jgi:hypothetical protein